MAAPARATATADPLKNGRSCSRITTRVTSIGGSSTGTRPSSPRTPMAWLAAQSQGEADAPSCPGSSPAGAADGGWRWPIRDGARAGRSVYRCDRPNQMLGRPRCLGFGGSRIEAAIAREVLLVVEPMAVEAALDAERRRMEGRDERQRIADLELQQARYEASLAERRYAACDPDHRLIAAQLEKSWEASLQRVKACEARLDGLAPTASVQAPDLSGLANDLEAAWNAPGVTMRSRQQLLRAASRISSPTSTRTRARSPSRSIGPAASIHSCASASRSPVSTAAVRPRKLWPSWGAWPPGGRMKTSRHR